MKSKFDSSKSYAYFLSVSLFPGYDDRAKFALISAFFASSSIRHHSNEPKFDLYSLGPFPKAF